VIPYTSSRKSSNSATGCTAALCITVLIFVTSPISLSFVALTLCAEQQPRQEYPEKYEDDDEEEYEEEKDEKVEKEYEKEEKEYEKEREKEKEFEPCWNCEYPCKLGKPPVTHCSHLSSPVKRQVVNDNTVLVCADGSFFKRLEFKGCYELNTSCNLIEAGYKGPVENVYTGYLTNDRKEVGIKLRTDNYYSYISILNGNIAWYEKAKIENYEPCEKKDILVAQSLWTADNPLTGCCDEGVNHLQATFYQVNIYGPHCSECYLVQAAITLPKKVHNA